MQIKILLSLVVVCLIFIASYYLTPPAPPEENLDLYSACMQQQYLVNNATPEKLCNAITTTLQQHAKKHNISIEAFLDSAKRACTNDYGDSGICDENELLAAVFDNAVVVAACDFADVFISRYELDWQLTQHGNIVYEDFIPYFDCQGKTETGRRW